MCNGNVEDSLKLYYDINGDNMIPNKPYDNNNKITTEEEKLIQSDMYQTNTETTNDKKKNMCSPCDDYVRAPDKHFSQTLINDMDDSNFYPYNNTNKKSNKSKIQLGDTFQKLFSPPESLICSLSFEEVRIKSKQENKFILVNIQNTEFESLRLNRDIWNNDVIQQIIKTSFILWLRYEYDQDAALFMNTYKVHKLPYLCVLCKRTGRQLKVWNIRNFQDPICAQSQLYEFIEMMEIKSNSRNIKDITTSSKNMSTNILDTTTTITTTTTTNINNNNNNYYYGDGDGDRDDGDDHGKDNMLHNVNNKNIDTLKEPYRNIPPSGYNKNKLLYPETTHQILQEEIKDSTHNFNNNSYNNRNLKETETKDKKTTDVLEEYNTINNELSQLHKLRMQRFQKK
ncbi:hypothetical protein PRSY57_1122600 [Plasmodium reichenowi]|uniref:UAS domain-containing protein n=1 Tax=Plasmodium reichenowi TaxID=5854 RepID=A0A151LC84_PLARE|nr:hypothetical protein PRSY57_1122600 [Plasmodium reichenowi]KYN96575.1 hypothetical protein PRSY57_1122600 [Plasmodium reichenowi]